MSQIDDGGQAFPVPDVCHPSGQIQFGSNGMTLRDYLAGQALAHIGGEYFASGDADKFQTKRHAITLALHAYNIADAMLAARKGGQP